MIEGRSARPDLPPNAALVNIVAMGAVVPEAMAAAEYLLKSKVATNLIVMTSAAERLSAEATTASSPASATVDRTNFPTWRP